MILASAPGIAAIPRAPMAHIAWTCGPPAMRTTCEAGCGERAGDMDITAGTQLQEIGACISASTAPAVVP
jgi:hypothetical protein